VLIRSAAARALDNVHTLQHVLEYTGSGEWVFLSTVNFDWLRLYYVLSDDKKLMNADIYSHKSVTATASTTLASAAFASPSRVRLASVCGLQLANSSPQLQLLAGLHASVETLAAAQRCGLLLSSHVVAGAVLSADTGKVSWLLQQQHCRVPYDVADYAARSGSLSMVQWLQQKLGESLVITFSAVAMAHAAGHEHIAAYIERELGGDSSCMDRACAIAIKSNDLSRLMWLHALGFPLGEESELSAAAQQCTCPKLLTWLAHVQGSADYARLAKVCAANPERAMLRAVQLGQLSVCASLRSTCTLSIKLVAAAVGNRDVVTLRWLLQQGCPYSDRALLHSIVEQGDVPVLECLVDSAVRSSSALLTSLLTAAVQNDRLAAAQFLRQQGAQWPFLVSKVAHNATAQWALADKRIQQQQMCAQQRHDAGKRVLRMSCICCLATHQHVLLQTTSQCMCAVLHITHSCAVYMESSATSST
jgi:hypothetical protein